MTLLISWAWLLAVPPVIGIFILARLFQKELERKKYPFDDVVLRFPGQSCRDKIDEISERLLYCLIFYVSPVMLAIAACYQKLTPQVLGFFFLIALAITFAAGKRVYGLVLELRNWHLGSECELYVAQKIAVLVLDGYSVYHDLVFGKYNIDHVVVGPSGIYAIETKGHRKGREKGAHIVTYDGNQLTYPHWTETGELNQATDNARSLARWLTEVTKREVTVHAVLTIPGWLVKCDNGMNKAPYVCNPKYLNDYIKRGARTLSPEMSLAVSAALTAKNSI